MTAYRTSSTRTGTSVRTKGRIKIDTQRAAVAMGPLIVGAIKLHTHRSKDRSGNPLPGYSDSYMDFLEEGGEDQKVDLRLTGSMMDSVDVRQVVISAQRVEVWVGPDSARSPVVTARDGHMARTGRHGPPHNIQMMYLAQRGFDVLGLSVAEMKSITNHLRRSGILVSVSR